MAEEVTSAEALLRDIYEAAAELRWFEQKHGLLSETFYRVYKQGRLRDEDPEEIQEYLEWAGWYEVHQDRRERYDQAIQKHISQMSAPTSLDDLHISKVRVPG